MAALAISVTACSGKTAGETAATTAAPAATEATTQAMASYESKDGWKTTQGSAFIVKEDNEHQVSFIYSKDGKEGKSKVIISYHTDKMPSEVLAEQTAGIDDAKITRSEGYFGARRPAWSYTRIIEEDAATGMSRQLEAAEHNGGTLLVDIQYYRDEDQTDNEEVGDNITGLLDTLEFTSHSPQQELAYNVGTYERKYKEELEGKEQEVTETITLNEDHSGTISFQDDIPIVWGSYQLMDYNNGTKYEYKVEGDMLYLNLDGNEWLEFSRKK